jgi:hypothetical protein
MRSAHYPIALAPDFDMARIDDRVRSRGHVFDRLDGLLMKAFLVQSIANGAARNCYAPFYVWRDDSAITNFLTGPLFGGVIESFGRPSVIERRVLEFAVADRSVRPTLATFETAAVERATPPSTVAEVEGRRHRAALREPGLVAACTLLDTGAWGITRVRLWADAASVRDVGPEAERFDVLLAVGPALHPSAAVLEA